ncbi:MAG: hypothetical protein HYY24_24720 [Verrucomicrobia bacterium]|nr:hypothetical protein [Verrucomicrobiota bacterium]
MPAPAKQGFWPKFRRGFRWFRVLVLLLVLVVIVALTYLNTIGLPNFVKQRLLAELHARGLDLQFTELRLSGYRVVLAEKIQLGRADDPLSPQLTIDAMELRFDREALKRLKLHLTALFVRQGRLVLPLHTTNEPPHLLVLDHISTELRLLPGDEWRLTQFSAELPPPSGQAGGPILRVYLAATVTNASHIRSWNWRRAPTAPGTFRARLRQVVTAIEEMKFSAPPALRVFAHGDAATPERFTADLVFTAPKLDASWGELERLSLTAKLAPSATDPGLARVEADLSVEGLRTAWGDARHSQFTARVDLSLTNAAPFDADWTWSADAAQTRWAKAHKVRLTAHTGSASTNAALLKTKLALIAEQIEHPSAKANDARADLIVEHSFTELTRFRAEGQLTAGGLSTKWGDAESLLVNAHAASPAHEGPPRADANWAWWAKLEPFFVDWEARARNFASPKVRVEDFFCAGQWRAPDLELKKLQAQLYGGELGAEGTLNVATRGVHSRAHLDFDLKQLFPLLTEKARKFLGQYTWNTPPKISGEAWLTVPAWTNAQPDWRAEVQPTIRMAGQFHAPDGGAFRGISVDSAASHLTLSNLVWHLPDLVATRPDGRVELAYTGSMETHDYQFDLRSQIDLKALRPLLDEKAQRGLDLLQFTSPPRVEGQIRGRWEAPERIGFAGRVAATNFTLRGETCGVLTAAVEFTNKFLRATDIFARRDEGEIHVPALGYDIPGNLIWITNATSTVAPMAVARAIGPQTTRTLTPYRFQQPPTARVHGRIPVRGTAGADAHFTISGGPFSYWRFNVPQIAGDVHWTGEQVTITNLLAAFYGGQLRGHFGVVTSAGPSDEFHFQAAVVGADLKPFMTDVVSKTNQSQGLINCNLTITSAKTDDWKSWQGAGDINLRDGQLWDVPMFGYFSHLLNVVYPGLGSTRASAGQGTFTIHDSIITSDDLEIREPTARLKYRGHVDFDGNVNAKVEAELLRDTWVVGRIFSLALWPVSKIFEYKVTGTLNKPKVEPLYFLPKFLLFPFHPIRTLEGLLPGKPEEQEKPKGPDAPPP